MQQRSSLPAAAAFDSTIEFACSCRTAQCQVRCVLAACLLRKKRRFRSMHLGNTWRTTFSTQAKMTSQPRTRCTSASASPLRQTSYVIYMQQVGELLRRARCRSGRVPLRAVRSTHQTCTRLGGFDHSSRFSIETALCWMTALIRAHVETGIAFHNVALRPGRYMGST